MEWLMIISIIAMLIVIPVSIRRKWQIEMEKTYRLAKVRRAKIELPNNFKVYA